MEVNYSSKRRIAEQASKLAANSEQISCQRLVSRQQNKNIINARSKIDRTSTKYLRQSSLSPATLAISTELLSALPLCLHHSFRERQSHCFHILYVDISTSVTVSHTFCHIIFMWQASQLPFVYHHIML
jgi:hypothetical protein